MLVVWREIGEMGGGEEGRRTNRIHGTAVSSDAMLPVEGRFAEGVCKDGGSSCCCEGEGEELHLITERNPEGIGLKDILIK